jgi:predicted ATPase/DNA-binding winged helix-turn-helix (wHTH) protein
MVEETEFTFDSYRLDVANACVWRGRNAVRLTGKAFAVLRYLVEHAERLVTKEELFRSVWPDVVVSDSALAVCVREIRRALKDQAKTPRLIKTVHKRGYRFIGPVVRGQLPVAGKKSEIEAPQSVTRHQQLATHLVGRAAELGRLQQWLAKALHGDRQVVFISGEPGIGKTSVVEEFLAQIQQEAGDWGREAGLSSLQASSLKPQASRTWIARGQCIEHFGAGEAYLPVLEAFGQLGRESGGDRLIAILRQYAPTWLVQMPALLKSSDLDELQRQVQGAARERMLREMAEAVEVLTAERPLVLVLEDLHWSDYSTIDWLSFLARRRQRARLLVLGTYRPIEVILGDHPLKTVKRELQAHGYCEELPLRFLTEGAVAEYLSARFPAGTSPETSLQRFAQLIHQRTDGNPLFMVKMTEYLVSQGVLVEDNGQWQLAKAVETETVGVPESLRQLIEQQFDQLAPEERRVLEAASVAGGEFSAAVVAAGLEEDIEVIEERCEALAKQKQFLLTRGAAEWPDEMVTGKYRFLHALYQEVLYERLGTGRRARLHQRIGEYKEATHRGREGESAAELAVHFEHGRDYHRAVRYLEHAARNASQRWAHVEAIGHLSKGLALLQALPETAERTQQELALQIALGAALMATKGYAAPEVETAYARARELCRQVGETSLLCPVLFGLGAFYLVRAEYQTACDIGGQFLRLAQSVQDPDLLLEAHLALGQPLLWRGEFSVAQEHMAQGISLYDPQRHSTHAFLYGQDPGVDCRHWAAIALWCLGYPDQALRQNTEALALARELSHPFSLVGALSLLAGTYRLRGEAAEAQKWAEEALTLARQHGFDLFLALGTILHGWALAEQGQAEDGLAELQNGLSAWQATGAELGLPYYLALLAEAYQKFGHFEKGLTALTEALATTRRTGERWWEAELYRLKGELTLQKIQVSGSKFRVPPSSQHLTPSTHAEAEAEACFLEALEIARKQQAKSLELRAALSLSRLWHGQGKQREARQLVAGIYHWFSEGFSTPDLQAARMLLENWSQSG